MGPTTPPRRPGRASRRPHFHTLSRGECEGYLQAEHVGRIAFVAGDAPTVLPVEFRFHNGEIVFRTGADTSIAGCLGSMVSFEVDHVDEIVREGWSILVTGRAERIGANELASYIRLGIEPWPGGYRDTFVRIVADRISGRAVRQRAP